MRILVANIFHVVGNLGDISMLEVAIDRLKEIYPSVKFDIMTSDNEGLYRYFPEANPVPSFGFDGWFRSKIYHIICQIPTIAGLFSHLRSNSLFIAGNSGGGKRTVLKKIVFRWKIQIIDLGLKQIF